MLNNEAAFQERLRVQAENENRLTLELQQAKQQLKAAYDAQAEAQLRSQRVAEGSPVGSNSSAVDMPNRAVTRVPAPAPPDTPRCHPRPRG